jgi:hypothetical protein
MQAIAPQMLPTAFAIRCVADTCPTEHRYSQGQRWIGSKKFQVKIYVVSLLDAELTKIKMTFAVVLTDLNTYSWIRTRKNVRNGLIQCDSH